MDYKQLLEKYMLHVVDCEGISFLDHRTSRFSEEEKAELKKIEEKVYKESFG